MALRELVLTHYEADTVLFPVKGQIQETVRVTVFGPYFPERAVAPELLVGDEPALGVSVARDQRSIRGFFPRLPPEGASIRVRYGDSQEGVVRELFRRDSVRPLPKEC